MVLYAKETCLDFSGYIIKKLPEDLFIPFVFSGLLVLCMLLIYILVGSNNLTKFTVWTYISLTILIFLNNQYIGIKSREVDTPISINIPVPLVGNKITPAITGNNEINTSGKISINPEMFSVTTRMD